MEEDMPIEHRWITKAIENAQKKVEGHNYDIRKHLLEYDDVMNQQRKVVYAWRKEVLAQRRTCATWSSRWSTSSPSAIAEDFFPSGKLKKTMAKPISTSKELNDAVRRRFMIASQDRREATSTRSTTMGLKKLIVEARRAKLTTPKRSELSAPRSMRQLEKMILLTTIDHLWKDHLLAMDHLREGIGLQGYGQKDPLIEYKKQGFRFFEMMMNQITGDVIRKLFAVQLAPQRASRGRWKKKPSADPLRNAVQSHPDSQGMGPTRGDSRIDMVPEQPIPLAASSAAPGRPASRCQVR